MRLSSSSGVDTLIVRAEGAIHTLDDLSRLILRAGANGTAPVRLGDVAQVLQGWAEEALAARANLAMPEELPLEPEALPEEPDGE